MRPNEMGCTEPADCDCRHCKVSKERSRTDDLRLAAAIVLDWCERNEPSIDHLPSLKHRLARLDTELSRTRS